MTMNTDNPNRNYSDPKAWPGSNIPPERLALAGAVGAGDVARVQRLLDEWPAEISLQLPKAQYLINARLNAAKNDLKDASKAGDLERVASVLRRWRGDTSLRDPNREDFSMPLIFAAQHGHAMIVSYLLDNGAVLDQTAPKLATKIGSDAIPVYQAFLDHGWDINSYDRIPLLHSATSNEALTKWFLNNGADPNLMSEDGHTALDFAASTSTPSVVGLLIGHGAKLEDSNALHSAVVSIGVNEDCKTMIDYLLSKGVDINALSFRNRPRFLERPRVPTSCTALHQAVMKMGAHRGEKDTIERVRYLLEKGADREVRDAKGLRALDYAEDQRLIDLLSNHVEKS